MNPSCRQNINSRECQDWLRQVYAQCNRLFAEKQLEFWDDWWLNKPQAVVPAYRVPHLMTINDCQKLRKNIAHELSAYALAPEMNPVSGERLEPFWQMLLVLVVACVSLIIIVSIVWLLNSTLRRIAGPRYRDEGYRGLDRPKCSCACPRSIISFARPGHPMTRYGPYR
ncbi:hypothetical protein KR222_004654, partial [Zaprionus bogoriensis]